MREKNLGYIPIITYITPAMSSSRGRLHAGVPLLFLKLLLLTGTGTFISAAFNLTKTELAPMRHY
jgi:hypothetical protein